jgi:hypothetical protein
MNNFAMWLQYVVAILSIIFMFAFGYFALFRTSSVMKFHLKYYQKQYIKSLKKKFFLVRYYQMYTKFNYELAKRQYYKRWIYYNMKICGGGLISMASFISFAIINSFLNHKL